MTEPKYVRWFEDLSYGDVPVVGGKNASLGEMYRELTPLGVRQANGPWHLTSGVVVDPLEVGHIFDRSGCFSWAMASPRVSLRSPNTHVPRRA